MKLNTKYNIGDMVLINWEKSGNCVGTIDSIHFHDPKGKNVRKGLVYVLDSLSGQCTVSEDEIVCKLVRDK